MTEFRIFGNEKEKKQINRLVRYKLVVGARAIVKIYRSQE
jgi:hypothetical protein